MSTPVPFDFEGNQVRIVMVGDDPWFVAPDVARVLGYRNAGDALRAVDLPERGTQIVRTPGGDQRVSVVSESGLYELLFLSRRPDAKRFKVRVKEILRELRITGRYEVEQAVPRLPDLSTFEGQLAVIDLLRDQVERRQAAELEAAGLRPDATSWRVLGSTGGDYSVREAAYILNRDSGIDTGQNRLFRILREWRLIDRRDRPYSEHSAHVTLRPQSYADPETGERVAAEPQVRITHPGLQYLHRRMGGIEPLQLDEQESPGQPQLPSGGAA